MKRLTLLFMSLFMLCGCTKSSVDYNQQCIDAIYDKGVITVGVKSDVPGLSYYNEETSSYEGLEIEIAKKITKQIFKCDDNQVQDHLKLVTVTVDNREKMLDEGKIDLMLATYTITSERGKKYALSDGYYTDYIGLMIQNKKKDHEALGSTSITSISDLDGKIIGVPKKATTRKDFLDYLSIADVDVTPIFVEYRSYDALYKALLKGDIDVMSVDTMILNGYSSDATVMLKDRFGIQRYGGAALKENQALIDVVNDVLKALS